MTSPGDSGGLWIRFLSGPDIDILGLTGAGITAAVQDAVRAHGEGRVVLEPRMHLVPDNDGAGHFNLLRGQLPTPGGSRRSPCTRNSARSSPPSAQAGRGPWSGS